MIGVHSQILMLFF